ncbi:MAG: antibiotic biosynthesis monooxygenase [Okeania sp. SIO1H5]|uniref:antibiotic biosynthesis monooxygenase n=1 Tax=Okeania sp. SIO1H5 TaxID=2607777 RepID=UPI0013B7E294|nr:antibiotic biosynthesis monooxygenase [Okeania sp. SIO1H5]NET23726.1 antibiotic biosynthesis monooxygenase [Okeania sp. SIO1H5]
MIVTCVEVSVLPDCVSAFIEATKKNHQGSIQEPGNIRFDVLQSETDPTQFMLYEAFRNREAIDLHKQTKHYLQWREQVEPMMATPRKGRPHHVIAPDPDHWE